MVLMLWHRRKPTRPTGVAAGPSVGHEAMITVQIVLFTKPPNLRDTAVKRPMLRRYFTKQEGGVTYDRSDL